MFEDNEFKYVFHNLDVGNVSGKHELSFEGNISKRGMYFSRGRKFSQIIIKGCNRGEEDFDSVGDKFVEDGFDDFFAVFKSVLQLLSRGGWVFVKEVDDNNYEIEDVDCGIVFLDHEAVMVKF